MCGSGGSGSGSGGTAAADVAVVAAVVGLGGALAGAGARGLGQFFLDFSRTTFAGCFLGKVYIRRTEEFNKKSDDDIKLITNLHAKPRWKRRALALTGRPWHKEGPGMKMKWLLARPLSSSHNLRA